MAWRRRGGRGGGFRGRRSPDPRPDEDPWAALVMHLRSGGHRRLPDSHPADSSDDEPLKSSIAASLEQQQQRQQESFANGDDDRMSPLPESLSSAGSSSVAQSLTPVPDALVDHLHHHHAPPPLQSFDAVSMPDSAVSTPMIAAMEPPSPSLMYASRRLFVREGAPSPRDLASFSRESSVGLGSLPPSRESSVVPFALSDRDHMPPPSTTLRLTHLSPPPTVMRSVPGAAARAAGALLTQAAARPLGSSPLLLPPRHAWYLQQSPSPSTGPLLPPPSGISLMPSTMAAEAQLEQPPEGIDGSHSGSSSRSESVVPMSPCPTLPFPDLADRSMPRNNDPTSSPTKLIPCKRAHSVDSFESETQPQVEPCP